MREHPEWFHVRADGTIAYAENPPKKYQDIYPLNFDNDPEGIYVAIRDMLEVWVSHGVTLFRVDNPHTKPLEFWQRLLAEFRENHPEVVFLAEAFTRPAMMRTLGAVGYHQSYTYFAWRNTKRELTDYFTELAHGPGREYFRPNVWPNTPDILHAYRNPVRIWDLGDGFTMIVGPNQSAIFLEVGYVDGDQVHVIVHAMKAREKFLR